MFFGSISEWLQKNGSYHADYSFFKHRQSKRNEDFYASLHMTEGRTPKPKTLLLEYSVRGENNFSYSIEYCFQKNCVRQATRAFRNRRREITGDPGVQLVTELIWRKYMMGKKTNKSVRPAALRPQNELNKRSAGTEHIKLFKIR